MSTFHLRKHVVAKVEFELTYAAAAVPDVVTSPTSYLLRVDATTDINPILGYYSTSGAAPFIDFTGTWDGHGVATVDSTSSSTTLGSDSGPLTSSMFSTDGDSFTFKGRSLGYPISGMLYWTENAAPDLGLYDPDDPLTFTPSDHSLFIPGDGSWSADGIITSGAAPAATFVINPRLRIPSPPYV